MDSITKKDIFVKMNRAIVSCKKCRLCQTRKNAVSGEGNINAKVVFVGEAPGQQEDDQGRPFVGRSGMLLNELMAQIGLNRGVVWIGNVIKCRPPENRDPMVDEIRACKPFLERQISIINPKIIVTLGRFAMEYFLPNEKISNAHGKAYKIKSILLVPLYHPAAALRNPIIKQVLVKDFQFVKKILENKEEFLFTDTKKTKDKNSDLINLF
ncbi:uracil-DNA glycosylase [Patescibacteria group bacterium]|nr:uracil-DNA glycosylase [Patescibacteria group bacterium]